MKGRFLKITVLFCVIMIVVCGRFYVQSKKINSKDERAGYIIALNEIDKLNEQHKFGLASEKMSELEQTMRDSNSRENGANAIPIICGCSVGLFIIAFGYVYFSLIRPFEKMRRFAERISAGDLDFPLEADRSAYFGEFTWAFDSMRNEIIKSRNNEKEAIENNKTVIATLSHDIKTPIASIRAYTEGLSANMDSSYEKRERYLSVIVKKCDEVARLTNDLFLHSVSELDRLKICDENVEICGFAELVIKEISGEQGDVYFKRPDFSANVRLDRKRFTQVCENLINNARKYAKTDIEVFFTKESDSVTLHFKDHGGGIPNENMPFIFDKFYRGSNCGDEQGSGLGLYIVKYITEKMGGKCVLQNRSDGLEARIILPVAGEP